LQVLLWHVGRIGGTPFVVGVDGGHGGCPD
jgi:hypothetical protein